MSPLSALPSIPPLPFNGSEGRVWEPYMWELHDPEQCCCKGFPVPVGLSKPSKCQSDQCCSVDTLLLERGILGVWAVLGAVDRWEVTG